MVLRARGTGRVGLLATQGTYSSGIYPKALAEAGLVCHVPLEAERDCLMRGIYSGVKAGDLVFARQQFEKVAGALVNRHALNVPVLGCTEIPLVLREINGAPHVQQIDPAQVLAEALADRALDAFSLHEPGAVQLIVGADPELTMCADLQVTRRNSPIGHGRHP